MIHGATVYQAEEATNMAMEEILRRWPEIRNHYAYAKRAVRSNFLKATERDRKLSWRIIERGEAYSESSPDHGLIIWEDNQWVTQVLDLLPPTQRRVIAMSIDGFSSVEIAATLGKTPANVRKHIQLARDRLQEELGWRPKRENNRSTRQQPTKAKRESK